MTASRAKPKRSEPVSIAGHVVQPGERVRLQLPFANLPTQTEMHLPLTVVHGKHPGPRVWVSAALHGDEINGVEVIREVLERLKPTRLHGTLLAAPIVNVFGFIQQTRYLPDGRDLNRSFPGSKKGSMAGRLAALFLNEVVTGCTHGIDLHTGARERENLPQVRADLKHRESRRIALAFGAPVTLHSKMRAGSLRHAARERGIATFVYEAGEALRFDPRAIRMGTRGVLRVLQELGMLASASGRGESSTLELPKSTWIRAPRSGLLHLKVPLGARTTPRMVLGVISDAFGEGEAALRSPGDGVVLGVTNNPVVHRGDALVHIGHTE